MNQGRLTTRRRFISLTAVGTVGAMGLLLAACGGGAAALAPAATSAAVAKPAATATGGATAVAQPTTTAAAATQPTTAPAKISGTVNWLVRTTPEENNGQAKVFEPAIKAKYPNIKLNRIIVPQNEYIPKINTMAAAKESLEIWGFGGNYMDYWARNLSEPLNQYIDADKWNIDAYFLPGLPEIYKVHGKYYGLNQQTTYGSVMVYNKKLFDEAGITYPPVDWDDTTWTFDKMLEYATKLTKNWGTPDGQYGINWALWDEMESISYLWGDDPFVKDHYTSFIAPKTNFNNKGNVDGHQLRHDYIYKYKVHPDPSTTQGLGQLGDPFKTSKIAMEMDGGWLYWTTSDIKDFKFGFAAVPTMKTNKVVNFDDFWIMGRWSTNKEAAWAVMRVLTDLKPVIDYSVMAGSPPAVRDATEPWLKTVADRTGQTVDDLKKVTLGAIDPKRSQESPDHLFLQFAKIDSTYTNNVEPLWASAGTTAESIWPDLTSKMDQVVLGIYNQFKDSMPKD